MTSGEMLIELEVSWFSSKCVEAQQINSFKREG